ncbi:hypothetical protein PENPOL_c002G08535 [Penicillium polonicum]|uniref:C2H2-type domain-containing protein n=1 Tax=Penicillium polonicum TaxID=60169 RepID=A0A1V6NX69_PENPO|nr:hypothetical protein PENPOL_c002G08535 [Penicillium polonicum]
MDWKSPKDGQSNGQPPEEVKIPCPVCQYRKFRSEQAFGDHMQAEHNIFPCHKCDLIYACRDDLAWHKSEKHGKANNKAKYKPKHKGKSRPVIRSVSPASGDTSSALPTTKQLSPQPVQAPVSNAHARQPSTETRKSPPQKRKSPMRARASSASVPQGDEQSHPAGAQVIRSPHSPVFHSRDESRQMRHPLPPRPVNVPQSPIEVPSHGFQAPSQGFQPPAQAFQPTGEVTQVPVGFYQASEQFFQPPMGDFQVPMGFYQASYQVFRPVGVPGSPAGFYQPPSESYHTPSPVYQSPPWDHQNQVENYRSGSQGYRTPTPICQTHPRRMKNRVQVYRPPLQVPQFPQENSQSPPEFWNSQFLNQESWPQESQHEEPRHEEPRHEEPQDQESRPQESWPQESRHQDPRHQDPRHQESRHQESQDQDPRHEEPRQAEEVFWAPARPARATHSPVGNSHSPGQYSQSPIHDSQQEKEVSHFPQQGSQSLQNFQSLVETSQGAEIAQSLEGSKSPEQPTQQAEQVSESFSQSAQPLELDPPLELSQFLVQVPQEAEKFIPTNKQRQSLYPQNPLTPQYTSQTKRNKFPTPHCINPPPTPSPRKQTKQTEQQPQSPHQKKTTSPLFIPPPPTSPTFSLVYGTMPHRWTDLEPPERTLILNYLLSTCHSPERLHSQGYNAPRTINTQSCANHGEPHQHHMDPRPANPNPNHRKAIVLDCEMIETTVCTSELVFITAIDFLTGEVLINSYVTPNAPVTNWLTPVSGITQEKMDTAIAEGNVFVSNADARGALRKFLNRDTVLIGHALQHDLRTLSLIHGRIVDTAIVTSEAVFPSVSAKTTLPRVWGLDTLAEELIGIKTQGGEEGHNSLEDALASREILIWCLRRPQCLKGWAEKTRESLAQMRNRRHARRNRRNEGGRANANHGQEERTAE